MANLSNINGKFVVDTAGNIGVGTLIPRSDANTTNISIQSSGTARLFVNNTGASGKEYAIYSSANGDFGIFDYGAVSARLIINSAGNATFAGNITAGNGTQAINADADLTLRNIDLGFVGIDFKSNRTSGNIGGLRYYGTASDSIPVAQLLVETDGQLKYYNGTNGAQSRLTIDSSGNATFAGSLTGTIATFNTGVGNVGLGVYTSGDSTTPNVRFGRDGTQYIGFKVTDRVNTIVFSQDEGTGDHSAHLDLWTSTTGNKYFKINENDQSGNLISNWLTIKNGNVGIGTELPTTALTVRKAIASEAYGEQASMVEFKSYYPGYDIETVKSAIYSGVSAITTLQTTRGFMSFWTADYVTGGGQSLTEKMRIESNGNVGIGATSPSSKLQVGDGTTNVNVKVFGNSTSGIQIHTASGNIAALEQYFGNEGSLWLRLNSVNKVLLRANGNSYFNGGDVGIGTTGPTRKLDVQGPIKAGRVTKNVYYYSTTASATNQYFHIKTNVSANNQTCMHTWHVQGYAYGSGQIIDCRLAFHTDSSNNIYGKSYLGSLANNIYRSSDNYVVLVFGTVSTYYTHWYVDLFEGMYTTLNSIVLTAAYSPNNSGVY